MSYSPFNIFSMGPSFLKVLIILWSYSHYYFVCALNTVSCFEFTFYGPHKPLSCGAEQDDGGGRTENVRRTRSAPVGVPCVQRRPAERVLRAERSASRHPRLLQFAVRNHSTELRGRCFRPARRQTVHVRQGTSRPSNVWWKHLRGRRGSRAHQLFDVGSRARCHLVGRILHQIRLGTVRVSPGRRLRPPWLPDVRA